MVLFCRYVGVKKYRNHICTIAEWYRISYKHRMDIEIDKDNIVPVYEQIVHQVTHAVQSGSLSSGHLLPSIRQLAGDLMINQNTVAKAYKILESKRVIVTKDRRGAFVHNDAETNIAENKMSSAKERISEFLRVMRDDGLKDEEILELLHFQFKFKEE